MHELTTTTPDLVFWAVTLLLVMRLLASQDRRWWVAIGGCVGVASEAKWNIGFLVAALAAGFLLTDARHLLRSRYLLIGGLIAGILAAPDVIWQAAHGWPALDVFRALQTAAGHNRAGYWPGQILYTGVVLTPVWVAGAVWSLRSAASLAFPPGGDRLRNGDRAAVRPRRQGVLPGCRVHVPARGWLRSARAPPRDPHAADPPDHARILAAAAMVAGAVAAAPVALSVLLARAAHRAAAEDQLRPRRDDRLAEAGGAGRPGVPRLAGLRSGRGPRSWPATTARRERSTAMVPGPACRRSTAAPTTSGSGGRRRPTTRRLSR